MVHTPTEIWHAILRQTTLDPIPLEMGYSPVGLAYHSEDSRSKSHVMAVKRAVVLVCKAWRAIALPALYETLYIDDVERGRKLGFILTGNDAAQLYPNCSRGSFVRRICLNSTWPIDDPHLGGIIAGIIEHCPSLALLFHGGTAEAYDQLLRPVVNGLASSDAGQHIRKLDFGNWGWKKASLVLELMADAAGSFPSLQTWIIPSHSPRTVHTPPTPICITNLRTLVMPISCYSLLRAHPDHWQFPSLSEVHLKSTSLEVAFIHGFARIRDMPPDDALNRKVRSLSFDAPSRWFSGEMITRNACFEFLAHFPNLADLVFPLLETRLPKAVISHQSLVRIGISLVVHGDDSDLLEDDVEGDEASAVIDRRVVQLTAALKWLLEADFPKLSVIRIIDYDFEVYARGRRVDWAFGWEEQCREKGVRLEWSSDYTTGSHEYSDRQ
jgi:hypothetical protein